MNNPKKIAGEKAASFIKDGMTVGLGTGSTAFFAIHKIGARVKEEGLKLKCIATSIESENLAKELNIPIFGFEEIKEIDITIDGADEVDKNFNLIKGGGGALLREKIIAYITKHYIIIVDETKHVESLGKFHLPVEVVQFGWQRTFDHLQNLGCEIKLREKNKEVFITDNGNYILDCNFKKIENPESLQTTIHNIPGVVECGLFINRTNTLIIGKPSGEIEVLENKG
ncbi:MAG TPA: ribose-5-phosphate isomerase RpiA [Arachidicoccus soli]|uniref:Ribose-5-phosphate isomerase A n=1 Tax=Arachidicoccus soli TaxID=2341117 RepID=A0A386HTT7_9BACT|nr:ribose-5-phosphate isomerase RpiA [Arachidicoccus soli]AYD49089.1 ribose-5-phosphate isomerase RpiA [Arachidicoccus soli]HEU0228196.1 ribose-5-phosphate isomerase RpiA [Arachidicoccus soli]